jgi:hypothetical protein
VHAWKSGVIAAVRLLRSSYGRHIIENAGGARAYYAHLSSAGVRAGQHVSEGQVIGRTGGKKGVLGSGNSTGPHLHFEIRGGSANIGGNSGAGGGGSGPSMVALSPSKFLKIAQGGIAKLKSLGNTQWVEMAKAAVKKVGASTMSWIKKKAAAFLVPGTGSSGTGTRFSPGVGGGSWRSIGHKMMLQRWGENNWNSLNALWTRESGWNPHARNPSSGAYGIPQGLPPSKMGSAAAHGDGRAQIAWGLGYIASRYGSPNAAWAHERRVGWYPWGGVVPKTGLIGAHAGERVLSTRQTESFDRLAKYLTGVQPNANAAPMAFGALGRAPGQQKKALRPITIIIDHGDALTEKIQGVIDDNDMFHASIGRQR